MENLPQLPHRNLGYSGRRKAQQKNMLYKILLVAALAVAAPTAKPPLQFTADGTFHISVFNDIHFGESESLV